MPGPAAASAAQPQFEASREITTPLVQSILEQRTFFEDDPTTHHHQGVGMAKRTKEEQLKKDFETIRRDLEPSKQRLIDCASEPGASAWLTVIPKEEHSFCLSKGSFRDSLCLHYGWPIPNVNDKCACASNFSTDHAMICRKGGIMKYVI